MVDAYHWPFLWSWPLLWPINHKTPIQGFRLSFSNISQNICPWPIGSCWTILLEFLKIHTLTFGVETYSHDDTVHIWELVSSKFYFSYFNLNCKKQMYYSTSYSIFFNVSNLVCKMLICILINSFMPEYEYLHYELNYLVLLANYMYNFIFKLYNL